MRRLRHGLTCAWPRLQAGRDYDQCLRLQTRGRERHEMSALVRHVEQHSGRRCTARHVQHVAGVFPEAVSIREATYARLPGEGGPPKVYVEVRGYGLQRCGGVPGNMCPCIFPVSFDPRFGTQPVPWAHRTGLPRCRGRLWKRCGRRCVRGWCGT